MNISKKQPLNIPAEGKTASNKETSFLNNTYSIFAVSTALLLCSPFKGPSHPHSSPHLLQPSCLAGEKGDLLICGPLHSGLLGSVHRLFQSIRYDPAAAKKCLCSTPLSLHTTLFFIKPPPCLRPSVTSYPIHFLFPVKRGSDIAH